jgi:hypothetical protein
MTYSERVLHKKTRPRKELAHGLGIDQWGDGVEVVVEEQKRRAGVSSNLACKALNRPDLPASDRVVSASSEVRNYGHHSRAFNSDWQTTRKRRLPRVGLIPRFQLVKCIVDWCPIGACDRELRLDNKLLHRCLVCR